MEKVFENRSERPIQNVSCDPEGLYLIACDWDGLIYFWKIECIENSDEDEEIAWSKINLKSHPDWQYSKGQRIIRSYIVFNILILTRPIALPPHAPVAQKNADQR